MTIFSRLKIIEKKKETRKTRDVYDDYYRLLLDAPMVLSKRNVETHKLAEIILMDPSRNSFTVHDVSRVCSPTQRDLCWCNNVHSDDLRHFLQFST